jgi:hypothetical protein
MAAWCCCDIRGWKPLPREIDVEVNDIELQAPN